MFDPDLSQPDEGVQKDADGSGGVAASPPSERPAPPTPPENIPVMHPSERVGAVPTDAEASAAISILSPATSKASFGGLLKRSLQIYKKQWWKLLLIAFLPVLVIATSVLLGAGLAFANPLLIIPFVLMAIVLFPWFTVTTMHIIADAEQGVGFGEASKRGLRHLLPSIWLSFLSGIVVFGGFLLIVPGIIWAVSFQLLIWVLVTEDVRGMDALIRIRRLIKGNWWRVFLNLLGFGLLTMLIGAVFTGLIGVLEDSGGSIVAGIQILIWMGFIMPMTLCFSFALFEDFKKWKTPSEKPKKKLGFILAAIAGPLIFLLPMLVLGGRYLGYLVSGGFQESNGSGQAFVPGEVFEVETDFPADGMQAEEDASEDSVQNEVDPEFLDSDHDGMTTFIENSKGTDPLNPDSDFDGLADGDEVTIFLTNPLAVDSDGDGFNDGDEVRAGFNPLGPGELDESKINAIKTRLKLQAYTKLQDTTTAFLGDANLFE